MLVAERRRAGIERYIQCLAHVALNHVAELDEFLGAQLIGVYERAIAAVRIAFVIVRTHRVIEPHGRAADRRSWDAYRSIPQAGSGAARPDRNTECRDRS